MCLAIYKPKNVPIPLDHLKQGFANNADGAGFAVAHAGKIIIRKGFRTIKTFLRHWKLWRHHAAVIHFRFATHGALDQRNCHPWRFGPQGQLAVVHNGILQHRSTKRTSDTGCFVKDWLGPLADDGTLFDADSVEFLEEYLGPHNKMAILKPDGSALLLQEKQGLWNDGIWYSNTGYKQREFGFAWAWDRYKAKPDATPLKWFEEPAQDSKNWDRVDEWDTELAKWHGDEYLQR